MKDPVGTLYQDYPYDPEKILASACGEVYAAVMLSNGRIGVCSTLDTAVETDPLLLTQPDLKRKDHRVLVTAYANAQINYSQEPLKTGDIFEQVDFEGKHHTVMVGYFPPLVEKFRLRSFALTVFDQLQEYPDLAPISRLAADLEQSDCIIISATTLINNTFEEILAHRRKGTDTYLLGPSTPLYPVMREQYAITGQFGMVFNLYDFSVLEMISKGLGTRSFNKKGTKVFVKS